MKRIICIMGLLLVVSGCSTTSHMGVMTAQDSNPEAMLRNANDYERMGHVEGDSCRFFALGIAPWGDSTPAAAIEDALSGTDADAVINGSTTTSLYGFVPIYNIFSFTCTTVRGTAIKVSDEP